MTGLVWGGIGPRASPGQDQVAATAAGAELLEIDPGAERGIGAGEDDHVDGVVGFEGVDHLGDPPLERGVEGVALVGPVEGHDGHPLGDVDQDDVAPAAGLGTGRRHGHGSSRSRGGRKSNVRSPSLTRSEAIQPPIAEKWSSRMDPSFSVASSRS